MKALTLWQPWASLVIFGAKKVETRTWKTKYRGPIAIHAAVSIPSFLGKSREGTAFKAALAVVAEKHNWNDCFWPKGQGVPAAGAVLGIVKLIEIEPTHHCSADLSTQELLFGNYEDGRYAWFLEVVERFKTPIPVRGNRMLWNWERSQ
jgi:hypothetical protein